MFDIGWLTAPLLALALLAYSFRILREYERGVVFMLGRFWKVKGPGLVLLLPGIQQMVRAIAKQAEAERERRDKVIHAEGELQASEKPLAAAEILSRNPQTMQFCYLQTLAGIAGDKTNTIVFPVPGEFMALLTRGKMPREGM
jgi:regulator of protease activity HflC (stomatin/prohibitin superfamily)